MEERQEVAEEPQTGVRGNGVKTKSGCETVFLSPPGEAVSILFSGKLLGFGPLFFAILPPQKSVYTVTGRR